MATHNRKGLTKQEFLGRLRGINTRFSEVVADLLETDRRLDAIYPVPRKRSKPALLQGRRDA